MKTGSTKDGFTQDFDVATAACKPLADSSKSYAPDEVTIVDFYRFEGESNPDDMSILYAIEANDGVRGTISSAYGTYGDTDTMEFLKKWKTWAKTWTKKHK